MTDVFDARLRACQERLEEVGADGVVLFPSPNLYYASGFRDEPMERHLFLFVSRDDAAFVAPAMYGDQIREETSVDPVHTWADGDDPAALVGETVDALGLRGGRLLLDDRMWGLFVLDLQETLPESSFGLASAVFDDLRMRKDEHELELLREAARISDGASEAARSLGEDAIGMTERELAHEMRMHLYEAGGEGFSFDPIVSSGPKSAQPHYRHGDRVIGEGEPVVLDFGTVVDGYPGDQTRTVVFDGDPPSGFEEAYAAVMDALEAGIEAAGPGVEAQAVDRAARGAIEEYGLGDRFLHRTGHGVGLEVHEAPYIVEGNDLTLEPGMVFSVEPGVYFEGEYGVRVEDLVAVTEDGRERLNHSPRTWRPL